jgi:hypothetical protein
MIYVVKRYPPITAIDQAFAPVQMNFAMADFAVAMAPPLTTVVPVAPVTVSV